MTQQIEIVKLRCPYCGEDVLSKWAVIAVDPRVYIGCLPSPDYVLVADWLYHSKCWDLQTEREEDGMLSNRFHKSSFSARMPPAAVITNSSEVADAILSVNGGEGFDAITIEHCFINDPNLVVAWAYGREFLALEQDAVKDRIPAGFRVEFKFGDDEGEEDVPLEERGFGI